MIPAVNTNNLKTSHTTQGVPGTVNLLENVLHRENHRGLATQRKAKAQHNLQ